MSKNDKKREQERLAEEKERKEVAERLKADGNPALAAVGARMSAEEVLAISADGHEATRVKDMPPADEVAKLRAEVEQALQMAQEAEKERDRLEAHAEMVQRQNEGLSAEISKLQWAASAPVKSADGWSSPCAKELVEKVPGAERELLLGDLLAELAPLAGETGQKESAQDVVKRILRERASLNVDKGVMLAAHDAGTKALVEMEAKLAVLQAAMVTERPSEEGWIKMRDSIAGYLKGIGMDVDSHGNVRCVEALAREVAAFRQLLGKKPMTAVAVVDDSTPALAERYSLAVLQWDGTKLNFELIDGPNQPWMSLDRPMRHAVDTRLRPSTFR